MRTVPAAEASTTRAAPPEDRARVPGPMWPLLGAVSIAVVALTFSAYPLGDLQPVGWDVHAYTWQIKVVGVAPLSAVGVRPGFPAMGALLRSVVPIPPAQVVVVLPAVLALVLSLVAAATARMAFRLPAWTVPVVVVVVATWSGTGRLVAGYEGTLLAMVLIAAAAAVLVHAGGRPWAIGTAGGLLTGACLAHLVFFAAFAAVAGLYVLFSIPALLRERREGVPVAASDAAAASLAVAGAAGMGAIALFGWLGLRPDQSLNTQSVAFRFDTFTKGEVRRMRPRTTLPVAAVGLASVARSGTTRPARAMLRLGVAWLLVAGAAVELGLAGFGVPGHRALLFALPLPVSVGLGIAAVGALVARRGGRLRVGGAALVVAATLVSLASLGTTFFFSRIGPRGDAVWNELRVAAAYLERLPGQHPVVFIVNQEGHEGAYTPKLKLNVVRSTVPAAYVTRTFVYVGDLRSLRARRPTIVPEQFPWQKNYNAISRQMWAQAGPALRRGAVVLIARHYARGAFAEAVAEDPGGLVGPGAYVVIGPRDPVPALGPAPRFNVIEASLSAAALFVILLLVGWGFALRTLRPAGATAADVACIAPAFGAGGCILVAFVIAAAGGDPASWLGVAALVLLVIGSAVTGVREPRAGERLNR
jgi:hypothetical protein